MNRVRLLVMMGLTALVLPVTALGAGVDKGSSKPPTRLTEYHKAIWMSEWVACWRPLTLRQLARELRMTKVRIVTPQQGARVLSTRAMRFLYEDRFDTKVAVDGCRNGILWRFYHQ